MPPVMLVVTSEKEARLEAVVGYELAGMMAGAVVLDFGAVDDAEAEDDELVSAGAELVAEAMEDEEEELDVTAAGLLEVVGAAEDEEAELDVTAAGLLEEAEALLLATDGTVGAAL
ncbi:hypothetical protein LTR62_002522 [Meristemomyces frigidus]|uniref:Uncharacterized protein n=1 Tax=Meristemomyces frigidus TaxID=1508187 RepID=A0AAN7TFJ7_9PEZI|nr:hypothetical protein LTR62_002522 [Meristemomyces frigidus]